MKRNFSTLIYISLAILSLLGLLAAAAYGYGTLFGGSKAKYVTLCVPALVGTVWDEDQLPDGFCPGVTYVFDDTHPAGTVLSQSPAANTERTTRTGHPVLLHLTVSLGRQDAKIPSLVGCDVRQAEAQLRAMGLTVRTLSRRVPDSRDFCVLSQSAGAGEQLPLGSTVTLIYAAPRRQKSVLVPDLAGLDRTHANQALLRAGLLPGKLTLAGDPDEQDGTVVTRQSIPSGSRVPPGTTIDYTLSRTVIPWNFPFAEESSKESADFTQ